MKNYKFKTSFVSPERSKTRCNKTDTNFMISNIRGKLCNTVLYMNFQQGWEPVLIPYLFLKDYFFQTTLLAYIIYLFKVFPYMRFNSLELRLYKYYFWRNRNPIRYSTAWIFTTRHSTKRYILTCTT